MFVNIYTYTVYFLTIANTVFISSEYTLTNHCSVMANSHTLDYDQVSRLDDILSQPISIDGCGNFPSLEVHPHQFVNSILDRLAIHNVQLHDVRLNGSAASFALGGHEAPSYHDIDVIFRVKMDDQDEMDKIKQIVFDVLLDSLPDDVVKDKLTDTTLQGAYVRKMVKIINEGDCWSLISLCNNDGKNFELKFVDRMRRQFEFSVDSFQIILDSMLEHYKSSCYEMCRNIFPTVIGESVYGDFASALSHLKNRLIVTRKPEEIRGGGLLKYCNLLVHGFIPLDTDHLRSLERYMCSRFFIDFADVQTQWQKLQSYVADHFIGEDHHKLEFLKTLYNVIGNSTVCLMRHERWQTLDMIDYLIGEVYNSNATLQPLRYNHFIPVSYMPQQQPPLNTNRRLKQQPLQHRQQRLLPLIPLQQQVIHPPATSRAQQPNQSLHIMSIPSSNHCWHANKWVPITC